MRDFGVAVAPEFRESALFQRNSADALRLWLYLASRAAHVPCRKTVGRQVIDLAPCQHVTSMRSLREDVGGGTARLYKSLRELSACGAIAIEQIEAPATYPERKRSRTQTGNVGTYPNEKRQRTGNRNGVRSVISRITINGVRQLRGNANVPNSETTSSKATASPVTVKDRRDLKRFEAQMQVEGR